MGAILDRRTNQGHGEGRERERGEINMHLVRDACLTFARYWATTPLWATARRSPRTFEGDGEEEEQEEEGVREARGVSYPMLLVCKYLHKFTSWMGCSHVRLQLELRETSSIPMQLYLVAP